MMIFVQMGNLTIQAGLPRKNEKITRLPLFPIPGEYNETFSKVKSEVLDMTSNDWVRNETIQFHMSQIQI